MSRRIFSRNFHSEIQSGFQIMQIYVNFMHMIIFFIIFSKIRGFESQNHMNMSQIDFSILNISETKKLCDYLFFLLYSIVLQISYVFLCFCNLRILLFFYLELFKY